MSSIIDDIKDNFWKNGNAVTHLILINVVVFLLLLVPGVLLKMTGFANLYQTIISFIALPAFWLDVLFKPWTLISYAFVHEEIFHILFNMLFLYTFGNIVGDLVGGKKIISLYVWGAITGGLVYLLFYNLLPYFSAGVHSSVLLGASASVFAIVIGAATLSPDYKIQVFVWPIKIKYIAAFYVVLSYAETIGSNPGGNLAHLGGALIGYIFIRQLQRGKDMGKPIHSIIDFVSGLVKPKPKMRVTYNSSKQNNDTPSQAEIDAILDKISVSGYEALSKEEKQKLFSASKK